MRPQVLAAAMLAGCAASPGAAPTYEQELERVRRAIESAPEGERQAFEAKMNELDVFIRHLRCEGAMQVPAPDRIKAMIFVKWPLSLDFSIRYPLVMQVQVEPYDPSATKVFLAARQQGGEAPWEITEIWTETAGAMRNDLGVPSAEIQQRINKDLPRLLREGEQANDRWRWPACALVR